MKNTALGKFIFIVGTALLLGGCSGMVMPPYATHGTSVGIIAPAGGYSEWHTDSRNHTTGDSHSQSQETAPKVKIASSAKMVSHGHTKATVTPVVKPTAVAPAKPAPAASVSASGACWC